MSENTTNSERPILPTPAPATSEGQDQDQDAEECELCKQYADELAAATRRAEEAERERDDALKMCKELDAQATKLLEQMKKNS